MDIHYFCNEFDYFRIIQHICSFITIKIFCVDHVVVSCSQYNSPSDVQDCRPMTMLSILEIYVYMNLIRVSNCTCTTAVITCKHNSIVNVHVSAVR